MPYICEEHKLSFEDRNQIKAHTAFKHGGEKIDLDSLQVEETPEGFEYKPNNYKSAKSPSGEKSPPRPKPEPVEFSSPEGSDEERLQNFLQSIGVRDNEVAIIVRGYSNIPNFRNDANAFAHWLDTHISDNKLKGYIPLIVQEMFGNHNSVPVFPTNMYPTGYPNYHPYPTPPGVGYHTGYPPPNYPVINPASSGLTSEIKEMLEAQRAETESLKQELLHEREEREREKQEREREKAEAITNARFERLESSIGEIIKVLNQGTSSAKEESSVLILKREIESMRTDLQNERNKVLESRLEGLEKLLRERQPSGKTIEDIAAEVAPIAMDKIERMGEGIRQEARGLREGIIPKLPNANITPKDLPKTSEDIIAEAQVENEFESAYNDMQEENVNDTLPRLAPTPGPVEASQKPSAGDETSNGGS